MRCVVCVEFFIFGGSLSVAHRATENLSRSELTILNLILDLHSVPCIDPDWKLEANQSSIKDCYSTLRKVREELIERYQEEFWETLIGQAVDRNDRYHPVHHYILKEGDTVLLKEVNKNLMIIPWKL